MTPMHNQPQDDGVWDLAASLRAASDSEIENILNEVGAVIQIRTVVAAHNALVGAASFEECHQRLMYLLAVAERDLHRAVGARLL